MFYLFACVALSATVLNAKFRFILKERSFVDHVYTNLCLTRAACVMFRPHDMTQLRLTEQQRRVE